MRIPAFTALSICGALLSPTSWAADPPSKAPAAKSPAIYVSGAQLAAAMQEATTKGQNPAVSQIGSTDEYFINQVHRTGAAVPNAHPGWTEVHIILSGSGTLITGGNIKSQPDGTKIIADGVIRKVSTGDVVIVPADTPHWYSQIDGTLDAIEVRYLSHQAARAGEITGNAVRERDGDPPSARVSPR